MRIKLLKIPYCETDVNEGKINIRYPSVPLGLPILKSLLRKNNFKVDQDDLSVKVFKQNLNGNFINLDLFNDEKKINNFIKTKNDPLLESESLKILNLTDHKGFDLFGISIEEANNASAFGIVSFLCHHIKKKYSVPVVCGGRIPYEVVNKLLLNGIIDYWVTEGKYVNQQQVFVEFCKEFEKRNFSPDEIPQIAYNQGGKVKTTKGSLEKEGFVTPDFEGLPLELYRRNSKKEIEGRIFFNDLLVLPYFFVKGCPNRCAFCSNSSWEYFQTNDPEKVSEDLKLLSKKYRTKYFYFLNSSINPTKEYVNLLTKSFINKDLSIFFTDCANFKNMDGKILAKLKEAGAARLIYGLETASPRLLKYINKNITIKKAERILKKTYKAGIWGEIELIAGLPYETEKDVTQTIKFIQKNEKYIQQINSFKFWIDGRFLKEPDKFGLRCASEKKEASHIPENKRSFDELTGLSWKDKVKQTNRSYNKLKKCVSNEVRILPGFSSEKILFITHLTDYMYKKNYDLNSNLKK